MHVPLWIWAVTLIVILGFFIFDFYSHVRTPHEPTLKESGMWTLFYVGLALLFGAMVWIVWDHEHGMQYLTGYVTEKALSVDNLFVFALIMGAFKIPRKYQQKVLLIGIVLALVFRLVFILLGAAVIAAWSDVFYLFAIFLLYTAVKLIIDEIRDVPETDPNDMFIIKMLRKVIHVTPHYHGDKLTHRDEKSGKKGLTPLFIALVAVGAIDVMFAFDSIPAIFGLTQETYLVFTAVAFSLMGLRQLYFLIDGLLDRLIYLSWGLAIILGFIGYKLIVHALHENSVPFINGGDPVHFPPEVTIGQSLSVIVGVLLVTVLLSLFSPKGRALRVVDGLRKVSQEYIALPKDTSADQRRKLADKGAKLVAKMPDISQKHRDELIDDHREYEDLVERARSSHHRFERTGTAPEPEHVDGHTVTDTPKPDPDVRPPGSHI